MDSDDDDLIDSDEVIDAEFRAEKDIQSGVLKVLNSDETFRCPFSPGRKKQDYKYSEILQHAEGVSKGGRGPTATGNHRALVKYLKKEMAVRAQPQAERNIFLEQSIPPRVEKEDKLVCPWMGILQNINNRTRTSGGFRIGPGRADIKEKIKAFNPESVKVFYDARGHLGVAVVEFRNSMDGFKDAEAFEHSFYMKGRARKDFERDSEKQRGNYLYGWMATDKDVTGPWTPVTEHLKTNGDLKTLAQMVRENERKAQQQVTNLIHVVDKKESTLQQTHMQAHKLQNMVDIVEARRVQVEKEKSELQEAHKKELEDLKKIARMEEEEHLRRMHSHRQRLDKKMKDLEIRCESLKQSEMFMKSQNEAERRVHEEERRKAQEQLDFYRGLTREQEMQQEHQLKLIQKHEDESNKLENEVQEIRRKLEAKQRRELECQRIIEQLEAEKAKEAEMLGGEREQETEKEKEEYVKKITELEEKLKDLEEEAEGDHELVNALTFKHREANDEVEEAKKLVIQTLVKHGDESKIGIKLMGSLNTEGWYDECGHKFKDQEAFSNFVSRWEARLRGHEFNPIRVVDAGHGKHKYAIKEDDPNLAKLRKYGSLVYNSVCETLLEIAEWNPSGRYIVSVPWDFEGKRKATMAQIVEVLKRVIKAKEKEITLKDKELKELKAKVPRSSGPAPKRSRPGP